MRAFEEYFTLLQHDWATGILRKDFASLINVTLFTLIAFAVYTVVQRINDGYAALATGGILCLVVISSG